MQMPSHTTAADTSDYLQTVWEARKRAAVSEFDIHVVRDDDGSYWFADEGDYALDLDGFLDRIVHTLPGRMSGLY